MARVPKGIREVVKDVDKARYELGHTTKHWALVEKATGKVVFTLHTNSSRPGGCGQKNMRASMRRAGFLKEDA